MAQGVNPGSHQLILSYATFYWIPCFLGGVAAAAAVVATGGGEAVFIFADDLIARKHLRVLLHVREPSPPVGRHPNHETP
jgi:hypothetical protein